VPQPLHPPASNPADPARSFSAPDPPNLEPTESGKDLGEVELTYRGDAHSLRVEVEIDGPEIGEAFAMLFDTGATFTTLNYASLQAIGVSIESDAPRVTMQTANGPIEADLVLVDAIWLAGAPVEWVTVAVCDSCANPPAVGLLGLNVSQRFQVSLDHDRQSIRLKPRQGRDNRALDIQNWLRMRSEVREDWNGGVELKLTGINGSRREIESAVVVLECSNSAFSIRLDSIPPKGEATTELTLPRGTDCREQTLDLSRGSWNHDRF
jgi:clan AA aspartic protease (TIGR02281 family)